VALKARYSSRWEAPGGVEMAREGRRWRFEVERRLRLRGGGGALVLAAAIARANARLCLVFCLMAANSKC